MFVYLTDGIITVNFLLTLSSCGATKKSSVADSGATAQYFLYQTFTVSFQCLISKDPQKERKKENF